MTELIQQISFKSAPHIAEAAVLQFTGVSLSYSALESSFARHEQEYALQNVSFTAVPGEQIAVVGPNGAGKSTLFKLIVGMLRPEVGTVTLFGAAPDCHVCIAYVPQRSQIDWDFPVSVADVVMMGRTRQIGFFRRPRQQDRKRVAASLERVGALHLAKKQIGELSGGQQQRVFIARALAADANLLLLDEPLAGLDLPSQEKLFEILDGLRPDGVTVLMATHDLNLAAEHFDRIMLLNRRIVALGTPTAVLTTDHLLQAYGGQVQRLPESDGQILLADSRDDHDDELAV